MATKYYLLDKDGKQVDNVLRTKDELRAKVNEIMQKENCGWDVINKNYDYKEVDDGGVSTEENTAGTPSTSEDSEFASKEKHDSDYNFTKKNDIADRTISDDVNGWNATLGKLDKLPSETVNLVQEYKSYLTLTDKNKAVWPMKKNAIRILYLYNEFLKFYTAYAEDDSVPVELRSFLKEKRRFALQFDGLDGIKPDMADIIEDMLDSLKKYISGDDVRLGRGDFYDEIKEFDEELENLHYLFEVVGMSNKRIGMADYKMLNRCAEQLAENDEDFKKFCGSNPPSNVQLSNYLKTVAEKKYHLGRIKMDSNKEDSSPGWLRPEDSESKNVRISDDINDYLDLKNAKIFGLKAANLITDEDRQKIDDIKKKFLSGDMTQDDAQAEIDKMVFNARKKITESLKLFFDFMGIKEPGTMNRFASGLKRLDENEYQNNWIALIGQFKKAMENKIEMYKKAHSNDMTAEDLNSCVKELETLLAAADKMEAAAKNGDSEQLLANSQSICTVLEHVQKKTAEAKHNFKVA